MKTIIFAVLFLIPLLSIGQMQGTSAYKTVNGDILHVGDTLTIGKGSLPDGDFRYFIFAPLSFLGPLSENGNVENTPAQNQPANPPAKAAQTGTAAKGSKPATASSMPAKSGSSSSKANSLSGGHFIIKKLKTVGSSRNGYIANAIIRVGLGLSYAIQIEAAITSKEIIALNSMPFQSKPAQLGKDSTQMKGGSNSKGEMAAARPDPAEELMKWKKLLDAGAINQHDYDSIKSKILAAQ